MRLILAFTFLLLNVYVNAQHQDKVDFIRGNIFIEPIPEEKKIKGNVVYKFRVLANVDSVFLDANDIQFSKVLLDGKPIDYANNKKIISIRNKFEKNKNYELNIQYSCEPKQTVYFMGWDSSSSFNGKDSLAEHSRSQIWTQGQGKYTSHWLPSFDDMTEKVEFDLNITVDKTSQVIANGELTNKNEGKSKATWSFDMKQPMSSYLIAFVVGNYSKQALVSSSGIPIENYYYPQDSLKVEPTYRYTKEIFDFLEEEIGVAYPWQNYKQVPVWDFLYAGMENTGTTIFSDQYVIDSIAFVDKNYVNVNAHELAHQWFGNLVTEKDGEHHWLHEGFATYYAYLAERKVFGDDHFYWKLYDTAQQLQELSNREEGESLLDPKAGSLTFYEKGAWALVMLRDLLGDEVFKNGIKDYLKKYRFKNVTVSNFIDEMERASGENLSTFEKKWLESTLFPYEDVIEKLSHESSSIASFLKMEVGLNASKSDDIDYLNYWTENNSMHLKTRMLEKYRSSLSPELLNRAFQSDTVPVRQSLLSQRGITAVLTKEQLISLLSDRSYITKEMALFNLWQNYPEGRVEYLEMTKDVVGLHNKNIRLLWLTLAILTEDYNKSQTQNYFEELNAYTGSEYSFEVRQNAFFYLKEAFTFNEECLVNLMQATNHHAWQFKKFARNLVEELLEDPDYYKLIENLSQELKDDDLRYIHTKLKN